jgi:extracellular elastinolytic metalloproteinase
MHRCIAGEDIVRRRNLAGAAIAALVVSVGGVAAAPAGADPGRPNASDTTPAAYELPADGHPARDKDNRVGRVEPNASQRSLAGSKVTVRWNNLGTPKSLSPAGATARSIAGGLSADPETAARQYIAGNPDLFGLDEKSVSTMETLLVRPIGTGAVVLLRQRFGDLPAGYDGQAAVLVNNGAVVRVTSSLSRNTNSPQAATLSATQAVAAALADAEVAAGELAGAPATKLVAVPTPLDGPRAAYAVSFSATGVDHPESFTTYVDARTGGVLVREDQVDFDTDNPQWAVYPSNPPPSGADTRERWCFAPATGCVRTVRDPNTGQAWDVNLATGASTLTSSGNSANNVVQWGGGTTPVAATPSPDRNYIYPFTDQWKQARCNPEVFTSAQRNDADAAVANLFAMHNRMHDWAFTLGFTEAAWNMQVVNVSGAGLGNDAEQGRAQSGAISGSRNNANQGTGRDGLPPTTNMFLWQPQAGGAYPPCVDGDYDMSVIGHEYTHAITNRMIAGPDAGIGSAQGGAMGESWGDLMAMEYMAEYGFRPVGDTPFVTGGYATGNLTQGIRNYDMSRSPLNYSDVAYDLVGQQVHADGEIWSATNVRVRNAFVQRYGAGTPALQAQCADGLVQADACPGNRRWAQLVFDSFLLEATSQFSMLDMRDNMLAADLVRFGGANQDIMWNAFATSGMGMDATSGPSDADPVPSFASPYTTNATMTLRTAGDSAGAAIRLYVGDYEARAVPVADTDPNTDLPDTFSIVGGQQYSFTAGGPGFGYRKFSSFVLAGRAQELPLNLPRNLASATTGGVFAGDGVNVDKLGDDTEATNWASLDGVAGKRITVDLAGTAPQLVSRVNVSALLRPQILGDVDGLGQNRFSALRSFGVSACNATLADCSQPGNYRRVYTSPTDAFPAGNFRPTASQLNLRTFSFTPVSATHLRLDVLTSQCTGNPRYAGEQDADPRAGTDCTTNSLFATQVRVSEFQVFTR